MCSVFVAVEQRFGGKASFLCLAMSKSYGASWTHLADFGLAGKPSQGCWKGGFRFVGVYGRAEMRYGTEERDDLVR